MLALGLAQAALKERRTITLRVSYGKHSGTQTGHISRRSTTEYLSDPPAGWFFPKVSRVNRAVEHTPTLAINVHGRLFRVWTTRARSICYSKLTESLDRERVARPSMLNNTRIIPQRRKAEETSAQGSLVRHTLLGVVRHPLYGYHNSLPSP